jgi:hypothetical protein
LKADIGIRIGTGKLAWLQLGKAYQTEEKCDWKMAN